MSARSEGLKRGARFAADLYGGQARGLFDSHVRRNDFARLRSVVDPYPVYEQIRAAGPFVETPTGHLAPADHAVCNQVLRNRRFGVVPEGSTPGDLAFDRSFLTRNPPDHTRLRRLAAPAFARAGWPLPDPGRDDRQPPARRGHRGRDVRPGDGPVRTAADRGDQRPAGPPGTRGDGAGDVRRDPRRAAPGFRSLRHARDVMVAANDLNRLLAEIIDDGAASLATT